jgi:aminopeptidase YwaD
MKISRSSLAISSLALTGYLLSCVGSPQPVEPVPAVSPFDPAAIEADISWLADDARDGRGVGTLGLAHSAAYIGDGFRSAGFEPGGDDGSFLARFQMPSSVEVSDARMKLAGKPLVRGTDFDAFLTSANGSVSGELVFAGYGITAPEHGYDDYAGIDVEGAIVMIIADRPKFELGNGGKSPSFLRRSYKFANAGKHGAAAVLLIPSLPDATDLPGNAGNESNNPTTTAGGVIAIGASRSVAEQIFAVTGSALMELQERIDATGKPGSMRLEGPQPLVVEITVEVERKVGTVANVLAVREGTDPALRHEAVVVGAHYDGLGRGDFGSLAPGRRGEIHNGADDNASGAAGLMALARAFGREPAGRRTLVLAAFAGEEAGLVGSAHYVRKPLIALEDTVAMVNMDMIGRLRDGKLIVFGVETSKAFPDLVERAARGIPLQAELSDGGYSASDQTSFYARDIPVLFFFTGSHSEYHTPDDDSDHINPSGEADVLRVVQRVVRELLDAVERPEAITAPPPEAGSGGGYGPYLGTIPDFGGMAERGVLLQGVRGNSPAEKAGLRAGDRIVGFDGAAIANLEEYAALLFAARPGQRVEVIAVRDGARVTFEVTLGQRR